MIDVMCSYGLPGTDMVAVNVSPITYTLLSTLQQVYTPPPPHTQKKLCDSWGSDSSAALTLCHQASVSPDTFQRIRVP